MSQLVIETVPLSLENLDDALQISNRHMVEGFYTRGELEELIGKDNHFYVLCKDHNHLFGVYYYFLGSKEEVHELYPQWNSEKFEKIGVLKNISFDKEYHHSGASDELVNWSCDDLFQRGAEVIVSLAWKKQNVIPSDRVLKTHGFHPIQTFYHPWDHIPISSPCPFCNCSPCICDGVFYIREKTGEVNL